jgi:hypothetical protein
MFMHIKHVAHHSTMGSARSRSRPLAGLRPKSQRRIWQRPKWRVFLRHPQRSSSPM